VLGKCLPFHLSPYLSAENGGRENDRNYLSVKMTILFFEPLSHLSRNSCQFIQFLDLGYLFSFFFQIIEIFFIAQLQETLQILAIF
jgi:hypothetical protein